MIATLTELHAFARTLPFANCSPLLVEHGGPIEAPDRLAALRFWTSLIAPPSDEDGAPLTGKPSSAQGFLVHPGAGCETASFGFMRRSDPGNTRAEWFWYCSCKTQYASVVSDAHLIACHTALVRLLDHAANLGINVVVRDETHYWETRAESRLLHEVRVMNQVIARFAGGLSDALGESADLHAPILDHPRFEQLEMGDGE